MPSVDPIRLLPFVRQKTVCLDFAVPLPVAVWGSRQGGVFTPAGCLPATDGLAALPEETTRMRRIVLFPATDCLLHFPDLPFDDDGRIGQTLPLALEPLLPIAATSCSHRFLKTGLPLRPLLTVSAEKIKIEKAAAGPGPSPSGRHSVLPRPLPLARALAQAAQAPDDCVLLDAGLSHCSLVIICQRRVVFFRSLAVFSLEDQKILLPALTAQLENTPLSAAAAALLVPRLENLAKSVLQTLRLFNAGAGAVFTPTRAFLSGPLALFAATGEHLARQLPCAVESLDLCRLLGLPLPARLVRIWRPALHDVCLAPLLPTVACRDMDLAATAGSGLPAWINPPLDIRRRLALLAAICVVYLASFLVLDIRALARQNALAAARMESLYRGLFPGEKRIVEPLRQMEAHLARLSRKDGDAGPLPRPFWVLDCLGEIARHSDADDIRLERLIAGEDGMVLSGQANDHQAVERLRAGLGNAGLIKPEQVQQNRRPAGGIDFELKLRPR